MYSFKSREPVATENESAQVPGVAEQNISAMVRMEQESLTHRSIGERFADTVTAVAVKPWFIAVHALTYTTWILGNTVGPWRFDAKPFSVLTTIISIEAIFLTLLVLARQQRILRVSDRRAHLNLQVDLLAEQEMTVVIRMLERLFEHFKLDPAAAAPQSAELRQTTDLAALVDKLDGELNERKGSSPA